MSVRRALLTTEMAGRELSRRRLALILLFALPLAFYASSSGHNGNAPALGGVAMAFSVGGASIFAALSARPVDRRLELAGFRATELLVGRLLLLELFGVLVSAFFSVVIVLGSGPSHPLLVAGGVWLVAVISVPFGLAVGALAPHELEAVLVLIGVVGIQLTLESDQALAKALPLWGPEVTIQGGLGPGAPLSTGIPLALAYAAALLALAAYAMRRRAPSGVRSS